MGCIKYSQHSSICGDGMNIQLIPRVCQPLADQANCAKVVELCGANADLDLCTAKIIGKTVGSAVIDPAPLTGVKVIYGFGKSTYHFTMRHGHDYLHRLADDLVQNIGGDGKIGTVGSFIGNVLGIGG